MTELADIFSRAYGQCEHADDLGLSATCRLLNKISKQWPIGHKVASTNEIRPRRLRLYKFIRVVVGSQIA